jgi:hypothetical protein
MRSAHSLLPLIVFAVTVSASELEDAKQQYLLARREAAKELYDAYKKEITGARANGDTAKADAIEKELKAFVAREREVLKDVAGGQAFDLYALINQAFESVATAQELNTDVQRQSASQKAIEKLSDQINGKTFSAEYIIEEVNAAQSPGYYMIRVASCPAAAQGLAKLRRRLTYLSAYPIKLAEREATKILPGDRLILRGKLQFDLQQNRVYPTDGDGLFVLRFPDESEHVISLVSTRAQLVLSQSSATDKTIKTESGETARKSHSEQNNP